MVCPNCGENNIEDSKFCSKCGSTINDNQQLINNESEMIVQNNNQINEQEKVQQEVYNNQEQNNNQITNNKTKKKSMLLPIIIVIILIIVAVIVVIKLTKKDESKTNDSNNQVEENNNANDKDNQKDQKSNKNNFNTKKTYDKNGDFLMYIDEVDIAEGQGTLVKGRVDRGKISLNDEIQIIGLNHETINTKIKGLEMFGKQRETIEAGDNVSIILNNVSVQDVEKGQALVKPNSIKAITKFEAEVYVYTKEEGGRKTEFASNYTPQFNFSSVDIKGVLTLMDGIEKANPGDIVKITAEIQSSVAMEAGTIFKLREGGITRGEGKVTKVYENTNNSNVNNNIALDSIPSITYDKNGAFLMPIEDVIEAPGKVTYVTGKIKRGTIKLNEKIQIIGLNHEIKTTTVTEIKLNKSTSDSEKVNQAEMGGYVSLILKDISKEDVEKGQVVAKPDSIKAVTKFEAVVYILNKDEGGRHTPFFNSYRPQILFDTKDITGVLEFHNSLEMVMPGDTVEMTIELLSSVAMEVGTEFKITEGGRTIGRGKVTKIN